jgi:hypothetical protein
MSRYIGAVIGATAGFFLNLGGLFATRDANRYDLEGRAYLLIAALASEYNRRVGVTAMMNERDKDLIVDRSLREISEDDFLRSYPVDPRKDPLHVLNLIEDATSSKDGDSLEHALLLGFYFGFPKGITRYLWYSQRPGI